MAPHSSTLIWKIPWTEEPGRLQSMGLLRAGHDWATSLSLFTFMHWRRKWQPTPVFLPGESQGWGEPGRLPSMGSHRVGHDWSDLAAAAAAVFLPGEFHGQRSLVGYSPWGYKDLDTTEWLTLLLFLFSNMDENWEMLKIIIIINGSWSSTQYNCKEHYHHHHYHTIMSFHHIYKSYVLNCLIETPMGC